MKIKISIVSSKECETAFTLTRELIEYHNALDIFTMTQERFSELIKTGALISYMAYADSEAAGIMNIFYKYTTFSGRKILYIEDLYVRDKFRGCGIGKGLFETAKRSAAENDCEHIELKCIDWNTSSVGFYESLGMKPDNQWITYTLDKSFFR